MNEQIKAGYVYILTNPSFQNDWVKIGFTDNVDRRLAELQTTGVPLPFEKFAVLKTVKYKQAEKHIHNMIQHISPEKRINPNREFFNIPPDDALSIFNDLADIIDDAEIIIYSENHKAKKLTSGEMLENFTLADFSNIKKEHIKLAVETIDKHDIPKQYNSVTRSVVVNDKSYPPKYVLAVAFFIASGVAENDILNKIQEQRFLTRFNTDLARHFYKKLGFEIETKDDNK